jgi:hypothetical protein
MPELSVIEVILMIAMTLMSVIYFFDKFNKKITPDEFEKSKTSEREYMDNNFVRIDIFKKMEERIEKIEDKVDKIYDMLLRQAGNNA